MYIDYHTHILPKMDDGAKSIQIAEEMLSHEYKQGVRTIIFTSHYYSDIESVDLFLARRTESFNLLKKYSKVLCDINCYLGAEVYLTKKISTITNFNNLCIEGTNYMLVELPYESIEEWLIEEIEEIIYSHLIIPIFAHVDRYMSIYNKKEIQFLLNINNAIFQINNEVLETKKGLKLLDLLSKNNKPFVFGSDSHNINSRKPNFNLVSQFDKNIEPINIFY